MSPDTISERGPAGRRGVLREGERVQITTPRGRHYAVTLTRTGWFQARKASFPLAPLIGAPEGTVVRSREGRDYLVVRPRLMDYTLSMPRGATIVYPKDAAQIIALGDIYPGARVIEAGAGSGALSLSLLNAVGPTGAVTSVEARDEFARIARANVELWLGAAPPTWRLRQGLLQDVLAAGEPGAYDRAVLDMLEPWQQVEPLARALAPGAVLTCYVATVTQMSRLVEALVASRRYTRPQVSETLERGWHVEGLAVRPEHSMIGHTGFLVVTRLLAPGCAPPRRQSRPAPAAAGKGGQWDHSEGWNPADAGQRPISDKRLRKVRRDAEAAARRWNEDAAGEPAPSSSHQ